MYITDDKVTGFGTPSIGGLGPMVLSKRCMTIKKPDSWYMKVFGYGKFRSAWNKFSPVWNHSISADRQTGSELGDSIVS